MSEAQIVPGATLDRIRMTKKERARIAGEILEQYYPDPPKGFLHHTSDYTLLIAVLLSAQCTDKRVNQTTPQLFALADNPWDMARQRVETVADIVRPCGLVNRKAPAIIELSRILIEQFDGKVPDNLEAMESLPGVGHKTASVMMCQAFGQPAFPVDTHIFRLARRWGISKGKSPERVEKDLKAAFPKSSWGKLHLQMILFGREHCSARGCDGTKCPVCRVVNKKPAP